MDETLCSRQGCERPAKVMGYCVSHYQSHRVRERRLARSAAPRSCPICATSFTDTDPRKLYCSTKCKDKAQNTARQSRKVAARGDRECRVCRTPISASANGRQVYCSPECYRKGTHARVVAAKKEARWEKVQPCRICGASIPRERTARAVYCSTECAKKGNVAWKREHMPGYMRRYLYGVTPDEYTALLASQDGRCAICRTDSPNGKGWHLDHDHETGAVRGVLCGPCNNAIGLFRDDPALLRAAADYLT